jgi:hypothetical protein
LWHDLFGSSSLLLDLLLDLTCIRLVVERSIRKLVEAYCSSRRLLDVLWSGVTGSFSSTSGKANCRQKRAFSGHFQGKKRFGGNSNLFFWCCCLSGAPFAVSVPFKAESLFLPYLHDSFPSIAPQFSDTGVYTSNGLIKPSETCMKMHSCLML